MPDSYRAQLDAALAAAHRAGDLLRAEFHRPGGPRGQTGHADIDEIAEAEIHRVLSGAFPEYGYRGEELGLLSEPRDAGRHTWIVDPNDGTADYLRGFRGSSVAIALIADGELVVGVVCAYCAPDSAGETISWARGCGPVQRDGRSVERAWPGTVTENSTVLVSTYADFKVELNARAMYPMRFRGTPSIAYRLALMAVGDADATVSLNAPRSWDFAAGHALLIGAGGRLADANGAGITYSADGFSDCAGACFGGCDTLIRDLKDRHWSGVARGLRDRTTPFLTPEPGRAVDDPRRLSRAQGAMMGQLAGDSLGSLVEFQTPERIAVIYPEGLTRLHSGGYWGTIAGQPTDDSEMALALARSIAGARGYHAEQAARAYLAWYRSRPFDAGSTTSAALSHAERRATGHGAAANACREGASRTSQANGSLMRVSPVGIAYSPARAWDIAMDDAALTHPHPVCREAGALFAAAISQAIRTGQDAAALYEWTVDLAARNGVSEAVGAALAAARQSTPRDFLTQPGWVLLALQNAFYQLLHAPGPAEGVIDTVARGGDTDTNGAIAGALLGSVYGLRRFPAQWIDRVLTSRPLRGLPAVNRPRPAECWPTDALYLAERLLMVEE